MFLTEGKSNYDAVLAELLEESKKRNAAANAPGLGGSLHDGSAQIPLFGEACTVKDDAVYKGDSRLDTMGSILVLRYLLTAGDDPLRNAWVAYRDFKDGAQFASYIKANVEDLLRNIRRLGPGCRLFCILRRVGRRLAGSIFVYAQREDREHLGLDPMNCLRRYDMPSGRTGAQDLHK